MKPRTHKVLNELRKAGRKGITGLNFAKTFEYRKAISELIESGFDIDKSRWMVFSNGSRLKIYTLIKEA